MSSWFGSGAALIVSGLAYVIMRHLHHLPGRSSGWAMRGVLVLMFLAGSALAVTTAGHLLQGWARDARNWGGATGSAIAVIAAVLAIADVSIGLWKGPSGRAAYIAAVLPVILGIFTAGALHQLYTTTTVPARTATAQISTWLSGS